MFLRLVHALEQYSEIMKGLGWMTGIVSKNLLWNQVELINHGGSIWLCKNSMWFFWRMEFPLLSLWHLPWPCQQPNVCDPRTYSFAPGPHPNRNICGMMINKMGSPLTSKRNTPRSSTFLWNAGDNDLTMVTIIKHLWSTKDAPAAF